MNKVNDKCQNSKRKIKLKFQISKQKIFYFLICVWVFVIFSGNSYAAQTLIAAKVDTLSVIDGKDDDAAWAKAKAIITHDQKANIDITIKAVYGSERICFLVKFPDVDESRTHKSWVWDKTKEIYVTGQDREDVFQLLFSMEKKPVDLSIYADNHYIADVWFWKACRTDPAGYADDKIHYLLDKAPDDKKGTQLVNKAGKTMYLIRDNDAGSQAFKSTVYGEYQGNILQRFIIQEPAGSVADIKAKGRWQDGFWVVELSRLLDTGHTDDVVFELDKQYQFGVSRYEVAGRDTELSLTQPFYGTGDTSEELMLSFAKE